VQPALGDPAWAGGWAGGPTEVPANPHHSVILSILDISETAVRSSVNTLMECLKEASGCEGGLSKKPLCCSVLKTCKGL